MEEKKQERSVFIELEPKRQLIVLVFIYLMSLSYQFTMGNMATLPAKLAEIDGMSYYAVANSLNTMGLMLALPLAGKLGDIYGRKIVAIIGMLTNMLCQCGMAFAPNPVLFVVFFTGAGITGGLFISMPFAMIADITTKEDCPKYYGILTTVIAVGQLLGTVIAGQFVQRGIIAGGFMNHIPLRIIAFIGILVYYPTKVANLSKGKKFDLLGLVMMVASIGCIVVWLSFGGMMFPFTSIQGISLLVVGAILLVLMIRRELHITNPSVPISVFRHKRFTVAFLTWILLGSFAFAMPAYGLLCAQDLLGCEPAVASTVSLPLTASQAVLGMFIGRWLAKNFAKRSRQAGILGAVLLIAATGILGMLNTESGITLIYIASVLGGISMGIFNTTLTPFLQSDMPVSEIGSAQGMFQFAGTGGTCLFSALSGIVTTMTGSLTSVFKMEFAFAVVALIIVIVGMRIPKES